MKCKFAPSDCGELFSPNPNGKERQSSERIVCDKPASRTRMEIASHFTLNKLFLRLSSSSLRAIQRVSCSFFASSSFRRFFIMESGIISQQNTVYVLNTSYKYGVSVLPSPPASYVLCSAFLSSSTRKKVFFC
jgi:hypothetical protein